MDEKIQNYFYRSCLRKVNLSKQKADDAIDRFASNGIIMFYYKCSLCNSYHLTKNEPLKKSVPTFMKVS